jgi:drug/metabolite transporter (DMT)-like permease
MTRKKALLYLVITSVLWSIGGLFIKLVDWNPIAIAGARSGIAAVVMLLYLRKPIHSLGKFKLLGACTYAVLLILFVAANKLTTSGSAILLQFTAPIWVLFFSKYFLKEKSHKYDLLTVAIVIFGMALFFIGDLKNGTLLGNFIALLSGVAMAGVIIFLKLQQDSPPVEMTLLGNLFTCFIALPFFFISAPNLSSIAGLLVLGVFQLGISYILYTTAIKYVSSLEAILIPVLEPLLNPLWVFLFTGESLGIYSLIGGAIILLAITLREFISFKTDSSVFIDE